MAQATGFLTNKSPYINQDLNTIFAPIILNEIDYGVLCVGNDLSVGETWTSIQTNSQINVPSNNVILTGDGGRSFTINTSGFYRLNITLNFGLNGTAGIKYIFFILSNSSTVPASNGYVFVPSPNMSTISAINFSGACGGTGNAVNYLNTINLGNCLSLNQVQTNITTDPYFFSSPIQPSADNQSKSNFFTLDITFRAIAEQVIYPYIRLKDDPLLPVTITLQNSKWMFTKINDI